MLPKRVDFLFLQIGDELVPTIFNIYISPISTLGIVNASNQNSENPKMEIGIARNGRSTRIYNSVLA